MDEQETAAAAAAVATPTEVERQPSPPPPVASTSAVAANDEPPPPPPAAAVVPPTDDAVADEDALEEEEEKQKIWELFAEEYHDIVHELPLELQRSFYLVRELEDEQQTATSMFKAALQAYLAKVPVTRSSPSPKGKGKSTAPLPTDEAKTALYAISKAARTAIRAGEDKVGLSVTMYESVDRHIRRLDADLLRYEDELVIGLRDGTLPSHDAPSAALKDPPGPTTSRGAIALGERDAYDYGDDSSPERHNGKKRPRPEDETPEQRKRRKEEKRRRRAEAIRQHAALDMPINVNEPRYCYCNSFSSGQMIGCDNEDCARDWFHLECTGMDEPPRGSWWCDECREKLGLGPADEDDLDDLLDGRGFARSKMTKQQPQPPVVVKERKKPGRKPKPKPPVEEVAAAAAEKEKAEGMEKASDKEQSKGNDKEKSKDESGKQNAVSPDKDKDTEMRAGEDKVKEQEKEAGTRTGANIRDKLRHDSNKNGKLDLTKPLPPRHDWRTDGLTSDERRLAREARKSARKREKAHERRLEKEKERLREKARAAAATPRRKEPLDRSNLSTEGTPRGSAATAAAASAAAGSKATPSTAKAENSPMRKKLLRKEKSKATKRIHASSW